MSRRISYVPFPDAAAAAFGSRRRQTSFPIEFGEEAMAAFSRPVAHREERTEFDDKATAAFSGKREQRSGFDDRASNAFGVRKGHSEFNDAAATAFGKKHSARRTDTLEGSSCESALAVQRRKAAELAAAEKAVRDRDISNLEAFPELSGPSSKKATAAPGKMSFAELMKKRAADEAAEAAAKEAEEKKKREEEEHARSIRATNTYIPLRFKRVTVVDVSEEDEDTDQVDHKITYAKDDEDDSYSEVDSGDEDDDDEEEAIPKESGEFNAHLFRGY